jgi:diaminohydroxyphosphoribosylaminopyrimidine deaminase/5-amino-6-(5-phosphoribosylamino)uracil reductase
MEQALALAALGEGSTAPNPRVGCLLVREGEVVGKGWHRAAGSPHAEGLALAEAGPRAAGATLYVNLEPCAHQGRTPPCTSGLTAAGVRRVVAAVGDPDPRVNGKGFAQLREAGVTVEVGLLAEEAARLNAGFLRLHGGLEGAGRPQVTLKAGLSQDGMLAGLAGRSQWITGVAARRFAHRLRLRHDAVLVGAETVRRDNPRLTVRLPGAVRAPLPVVLAPDLRLPADGALFRDPLRRPRVYVRHDLQPAQRSAWEARADHGAAAGAEGRWRRRPRRSRPPGRAVGAGGGRAHRRLPDAELVDQVALVAPVLLGRVGDAVPRPGGGRRSRAGATAPGDPPLLAGRGRCCSGGRSHVHRSRGVGRVRPWSQGMGGHG